MSERSARIDLADETLAIQAESVAVRIISLWVTESVAAMLSTQEG